MSDAAATSLVFGSRQLGSESVTVLAADVDSIGRNAAINT